MATQGNKQSIEVSGDEASNLSNGSPASSEDSVLEKPKRVRISRKQQIDSLRGEVQELNDHLQSLLPQGPPGSTVQIHNGHLVPRASMWEEIAARQLETREKSEEENAKLREMLQNSDPRGQELAARAQAPNQDRDGYEATEDARCWCSG